MFKAVAALLAGSAVAFVVIGAVTMAFALAVMTLLWVVAAPMPAPQLVLLDTRGVRRH